MKMYSNKFVLSVLVDNTIQKEYDNGSVIIPFATEYQLRFRNKNNRRAVVKFFIDGEEVSGGGYIIPANDAIDIKRHAVKDAAFKFVGLDSPEAIDFGKNGPNHNKTKGVIEARFFLEKEATPKPTQVVEHHYHNHWNNPWNTPYRPQNRILFLNNVTSAGGGAQDSTLSRNDVLSFNTVDTDHVAPQAFSKIGLEFTSDTNTKNVNTTRLKMQSGVTRGLSAISNESTNSSPISTATSPMIRDGATVEGAGTGQRFEHTYIDYDASFYTTLKVFLQGFDQAEEEAKESAALRVEANLEALAVKSERAAKKNRVKPDSSVQSQAQIDAIAAEEEEARLRKLLADARAAKLRAELAELGIEAQ